MTNRRRFTSADTALLKPSVSGGVWRGAVSWESDGSGAVPWRVGREGPSPVDDALAEVARAATGVRARFISDASALRLVLTRQSDEVGCVDLTVDGAHRERVQLRQGVQDIRFPMPGVLADVELWLPQAGVTAVESLELEGASVLEAPPLTGLRWIAYGSSITQCYEAAGPTGTWPARVARDLGWELTCMGFSGHCFLDDVAAETIRRVPADVITICAGINIYNKGEWSVGRFTRELDRFVQKIREGNIDAPIIMISPIASPARESKVNNAGATLADMRATVASFAKETFVEGVTYVDGLDLLGTADATMLHDGLHPDADGYRLMANRLAPMLRSRMPSTG